MVIIGMRWDPDLNRHLTDREWQVWGMVAKGMGNDDIGVELLISERSVMNIMYVLYSKLNIPAGSAKRVKLALIYPRRSN